MTTDHSQKTFCTTAEEQLAPKVMIQETTTNKIANNIDIDKAHDRIRKTWHNKHADHLYQRQVGSQSDALTHGTHIRTSTDEQWTDMGNPTVMIPVNTGYTATLIRSEGSLRSHLPARASLSHGEQRYAGYTTTIALDETTVHSIRNLEQKR